MAVIIGGGGGPEVDLDVRVFFMNSAATGSWNRQSSGAVENIQGDLLGICRLDLGGRYSCRREGGSDQATFW